MRRPRSSFSCHQAAKRERIFNTPESFKHTSQAQSAVLALEEEPPKLDVLSFDWSDDPVQIDAELSAHYLRTYFDYVNNATCRIFLLNHFLRWPKESTPKSPEDIMTIYAMLALGSIFLSRSDHVIQGAMFCRLAKMYHGQRSETV